MRKLVVAEMEKLELSTVSVVYKDISQKSIDVLLSRARHYLPHSLLAVQRASKCSCINTASLLLQHNNIIVYNSVM